MDSFNEAYAGTPPWDIGRPQEALGVLLRERADRGSLLDAGCGTGENALYAASLGYETWGIDGAPAAIAKAREKAAARGQSVTFEVHDALQLATLGRTFDTVTDSGLFHVFDDEARTRYVASLAAAVRSGGRYFMMCFSDEQPGDWGPRRVSQAEIRAAFATDWRVDEIRAATFDTHVGDIRAWLASLTRL
jgi:cyclopropane fatty-acyl-phospholipid synthase-like methyltransferase